MSNRWSFTPQFRDSDGQSDSKHFDEESRDYLPSNSRENQSEDDHESTDDGFDLFTDLSTQCQWVCLSCMTSAFFFLLLIEIISIEKLLIIVHVLVWKCEKQTLSYIHTKCEGDRNTCFFFLIYFVGAPVFLSQHWKFRGRTYAKKLRFLRKKRAGYANLKMPCICCTQKTVTSHIKVRLDFSFFAPSREGL